MDCSTPGLPFHHQLPELAHTHVHWVGDAIQPSHPLLSPSPPTFSLSQHQGVFQWVSSLHQVARVLEFQLQHLSFQWIFQWIFSPWVTISLFPMSVIIFTFISSLTPWAPTWINRLRKTKSIFKIFLYYAYFKIFWKLSIVYSCVCMLSGFNCVQLFCDP